MLNRKLAGAALAALVIAAPAMAQEKYRIAAVNSVTGPLAFAGISVKKGSDLAIEMHNGGKVNGRTIEIVWEDDETKPQVTAQKGAKLVTGNFDLMLGSVNTPSTLALMKITEQRKLPHLITLGGGDQITGANKTAYAYRTTIRLDMENRTGAAYVRQMKFKKLYGVSFDYQVTRQRWDAFKQLVLSTTQTQIAGESFSPLENMDFSLIIENAIRSGADAFWIDLPGTVGTAFLKQAAQVNLKGKMKLFGPVVVDDESAASIGDGALGVSSGTRWHWSLDNPESKKFVEAFKKKYNELPDQYAGEAYDGLAWWLAHVEKQKTFDKEALLKSFSTSVWDKSIKGTKSMRACDNQAMQVGYWGDIIAGPQGGPKYVLKISSTFPPEEIFPPCAK